MKSSLAELLLVLETLRVEKHPEIPSDVIIKIAEIQRDNQEGVAARQAKIKSYIDQITDSFGEIS